MASWQIKQLEKMSETDPDLIDDVLHHFYESNPVRLEKLGSVLISISDINLGKAASRSPSRRTATTLPQTGHSTARRKPIC